MQAFSFFNIWCQYFRLTSKKLLIAFCSLPSIWGCVLQIWDMRFKLRVKTSKRAQKLALTGTQVEMGAYQQTKTKMAYQQLRPCPPCPAWRPPLAAFWYSPWVDFGSCSQSLRCHQSVKKKKKTHQATGWPMGSPGESNFWEVHQKITTVTERGLIVFFFSSIKWQ